ncbi:MAG TPA: glutathione S-transferase family protein [Caulobacteraceae bacterium]|jgi:glutathione S-transferase
MILIGQYDSPFVRRVAVALSVYGMAYEHRPWSTFGDGDRIAEFNPLRRVPTLVLDSGEALIESFAILDHLDELAGSSRALIPASGPQRRSVLRVCALATGLCDKMVSLVYERILHEAVSPTWVSRCETQIGQVLQLLEEDRAGRASPHWFGDRLGHADIAVACALRFLSEAHPNLAQTERRPALAAHAARCEALDAFAGVVQPFIPPAR